MSTITPTPGRRHCATSTLVAATCAIALTACGSSSKSSSASASSGRSQGIEYSECMRSHGVPSFPDPSSGGGGIRISVGSGVNPQSPAFQSAQNACSKLLPGGGPANGKVAESRKLALLKLAECMRAHGIASFPDPTISAPTAPAGGGGIAFGSPGAFLSVSQSTMQSPGFKQAAAACGFPGFGAHGGAKAAPAPAG